MASSSEYEQRRCFEDNASEQEACNAALKKIIDNHDLKEKLRKSFMDSITHGEERVYIEN